MERAGKPPVLPGRHPAPAVTHPAPVARRLSGGAACVLVVLIAACASEPVEPSASEPPEPSADPAVQEAPDRMPTDLLGTYDSDANACAEGITVSRLTVAPDTLRFYYGYATVDAVEGGGAGTDVEATLYQTEGAVEVVPEPASYRFESRDGGLVLERSDAPPDTLVRCGPGAARPGDPRP